MNGSIRRNLPPYIIIPCRTKTQKQPSSRLPYSSIWLNSAVRNNSRSLTLLYRESNWHKHCVLLWINTNRCSARTGWSIGVVPWCLKVRKIARWKIAIFIIWEETQSSSPVITVAPPYRVLILPVSEPVLFALWATRMLSALQASNIMSLYRPGNWIVRPVL